MNGHSQAALDQGPDEFEFWLDEHERWIESCQQEYELWLDTLQEQEHAYDCTS